MAFCCTKNIRTRMSLFPINFVIPHVGNLDLHYLFLIVPLSFCITLRCTYRSFPSLLTIVYILFHLEIYYSPLNSRYKFRFAVLFHVISLSDYSLCICILKEFQGKPPSNLGHFIGVAWVPRICMGLNLSD